MLHISIFKVKKFQLPAPKRFSIVVINGLGGGGGVMSNRVKGSFIGEGHSLERCVYYKYKFMAHSAVWGYLLIQRHDKN